MFILTSAGECPVADEAELAARIEHHRTHGDRCIQLHADDGAYLSAVGEGFGPYALEWFPADPTGTHAKAAEALKQAEVRDAFLDFFRGGHRWREAYAWVEVPDEPAPWLTRVLGRLFGPAAGPSAEPKPTAHPLE